MTKWLLSLGLILFFTFSAHAQSLTQTARSVRALGMGGVAIPFQNDADALFYNPAALGKLSGLNIKLADVSVGLNSIDPQDLRDIQNADPNNPSTYNGLFGKRVWAEAEGRTAIALPYIAFGYLTDYEASAELHNPANPQFNTYFRNDSAYYIGGAVALGPSSYLGMNVKRITRWGGINQDLTISDVSSADSLSDIGDRFSNKGQGYGMDLAAQTEIDGPLKTTLAVVWQDVGSTAFTKTAGTDAPPHIEQNLSFGAGTGFELPGIDWNVGAELDHLLEPDIDLGKKVHLGTELSLPLVDVRCGYGQGYFSYGASVNFLIFHVDAVSYTEELGVYPGQTADKRYMVSLSIDLSFDANFHFTDNDGKKRKLKQRR